MIRLMTLGPTATAFGERVRARMTALGLSRIDVASEVRVDTDTARRWISGSHFPRADLLPRLADVLEIELRELLTGEQPQSGEQRASSPGGPPQTSPGDQAGMAAKKPPPRRSSSSRSPKRSPR